MSSPQLADGPEQAGHRLPLVVEIDALFGIDERIESVLASLRSLPRPAAAARRYRADAIAYLREQQRGGRSIILWGGDHSDMAQSVAGEVGLFDRVMLTARPGHSAGDLLVAELGAGAYDYLGRCRGDSALWRNAHAVLMVSPSRRLERRVAAVAPVTRASAAGPGHLQDYLRALRPLHWIKNALLLVPLGAAHRIPDAKLALQLFIAWVAFSLCSSSIYLLNDLFDLPVDRQRADTLVRPLASGRIRPIYALVGSMSVLATALALGAGLPSGFLQVLVVYFVLMCAYSMRLKEVAVLDVLVLAGGYVLRVVAGSYVAGITPSTWLIALCVFLFMSLALIKRYAELIAVGSTSGADAPVRGYLTSDASLIASEGIASGYVAVLVLALYTNTSVAQQLYARHELFWLICLLLLYWINYLWLMARRGKLPHDPVVFALKDRTSQVLVVAMGAIILCAL